MIRVVLSCVCLLLSTQIAAEDEVLADIGISIQQDGDIWRGQQVTVNLDLKTTGYSFANTHFNLPEVNGAFLMQTDTTTIKFSEKIDAVTWQVIRYPLALYPQTAGQLEIPAIEVRFSTSAGFGSAEKAFEFQTAPLQIQVQSPPGVKQNEMVITTTSFKFDYTWQPESGAAHTGDALTLTVSRQASNISAMLLPPLPVYQVEGLATYPQAPVVNDKTNRGDLTGERTDSIIWVVEKPGVYDIPGIRFQWWDPNSLELKQQIIPGIKLNILPLPSDKTPPDEADKNAQSGNDHLLVLLIIILAVLSVLLWLGFKRGTSRHAEDNEKTAFKTLQSAISSHHAGQSYGALCSWLNWVSPAVTLAEFAAACDNTQLSEELEHLQQALISADSNWRGNRLLSALQQVRNVIKQQKAVQNKAALAPLNPQRLNAV